MVRIYLGKRRLGQVEESFFKRLKIGDVFVLAGRMLRLIESGVGEAKVEEARLALPTVPAWNANKMPLSSGLAREVREFRSQLALKMESAQVESLAKRFSRPVLDERKRQEILDWLVERFEISGSNAQAILNHCLHQLQVSCLPTAERFLIERYEQPTFEPEAVGPDLVHYFFHSLIGRAANDALSRILAWRVKQAVGGNAMVTIDDYGFLLTLKSFQELDVAGWQELFGVENAEADMRSALEDSQLVQWNFRGVAQTGLMVPRNLPWSAEILWRVLTEHEPDHPLLEQAYREATHSFLDLPEAMRFLGSVQNLEWHFVEVPVVSPFAFGMYASKIKEGMMLEDPEEAIERLWRSFQEGVGRVTE
jgi:ATP-dependent Lhr-like helicase